jgi:gluconate 2-dehydrogenase gamma chain
MDRRQTLKGLGALAGASLAGTSLLAEFFRVSAAIRDDGAAWAPKLLTPAQAALLPELVEVVIPRTDTPGAKDALVHVFVDLFVKDCYPQARREVFLQGFADVEAASRAKYGRDFLALAADERLALLTALERDSFQKNEPPEKSFVRSLKSMTMLGYFSSKSGATQAADYVQSPGPYRGCVALKPGQKVSALQ